MCVCTFAFRLQHCFRKESVADLRCRIVGPWFQVENFTPKSSVLKVFFALCKYTISSKNANLFLW